MKYLLLDKYDIIGKVETFEEDLNYILEVSDLRKIINPNVKMNHYQRLKDCQEYFDELTPDVKYTVKRLYGPDFQLFGYDPEKYM